MSDLLEDLKKLPDPVKKEIGFALHQVQEGQKPFNTKFLKNFGPGVMEIICDFNTNTYRTVYAIKIDDAIYVLHTFQKKSTIGIKTPQKELALIEQRLNMAKNISKNRK